MPKVKYTPVTHVSTKLWTLRQSGYIPRVSRPSECLIRIRNLDLLLRYSKNLTASLAPVDSVIRPTVPGGIVDHYQQVSGFSARVSCMEGFLFCLDWFGSYPYRTLSQPASIRLLYHVVCHCWPPQTSIVTDCDERPIIDCFGNMYVASIATSVAIIGSRSLENLLCNNIHPYR